MPEPASLPGGLRLVRRRGLRHANGGRLPEGTSRKAPATKNRWETRPMATSVPNPGLTSNGGRGNQRRPKRAAEGDAPPPAGGDDHRKEYESLLEEKSELIRQLHERVQELEAGARAPHSPKEEELLEMSEELERERSQFRQEQRELEEMRARLAE